MSASDRSFASSNDMNLRVLAESLNTQYVYIVILLLVVSIQINICSERQLVVYCNNL